MFDKDRYFIHGTQTGRFSSSKENISSKGNVMYDVEDRLNRLGGGDLPRHPETEPFQKYAHEEYLGKNISPGGGTFHDISLRDAIRKRMRKSRRDILRGE